MADIMSFPDSWEEFLHDYEFADKKQEYTNGAKLIPSFRVEQMVEHYFANPQPLTLEELKNLPIHEQVYVYFTEPYSSRGVDVPSGYYFKIKATIPRDAFAFGYPGVCYEFSYTDYGDTWEAYRTKPEGAME